MTERVPRLADVRCSRIQFAPGDRILVRVYQPISKEAARKLQKTVERWAGNCVEVLIVDMTLMDIEIAQSDKLPRDFAE